LKAFWDDEIETTLRSTAKFPLNSLEVRLLLYVLHILGCYKIFTDASNLKIIIRRRKLGQYFCSEVLHIELNRPITTFKQIYKH